MTTKNFTAVSLPTDLVAEVSVAANRADRSVPKQIEHWVRLAQTLEQILPPKTVNDVKQGTLPGPGLLRGLAELLANPKVINASGWRVHFDHEDPTIAWETAPDGTVTKGKLLDNGDFIPDSNEEHTTKP